MHAIKSLLVGALTATASATYFDSEALRREVLHNRQVSTSSAISVSLATPYPTATASTNSSNACSSVLAGLATLITGLPTPTGALYTYLQTAATTLTDPCVSLFHFPISSPHNPLLINTLTQPSTSQSQPPSPRPSAPTNPP